MEGEGRRQGEGKSPPPRSRTRQRLAVAPACPFPSFVPVAAPLTPTRPARAVAVRWTGTVVRKAGSERSRSPGKNAAPERSQFPPRRHTLELQNFSRVWTVDRGSRTYKKLVKGNVFRTLSTRQTLTKPFTRESTRPSPQRHDVGPVTNRALPARQLRQS